MSVTRRVSQWLIAWRWPLLFAALAATALAWAPAQQMEFDRSIDNMFAPDDPLLAPYQRLKRVFGGDELVVVAYVDSQLLTPAGIDRVAALAKTLRETPGVDPESVLGLDSSPFRRPQLFVDFFEGMAIGEDRQTTAVLCSLIPEQRALAELKVTREQTIRALRDVALAHDPTAVVVGEPVMVVDGFDYLAQDGRLLGTATTGLLMLVIVLCFRSLRWVLIPVAVVQATLWWTQATLSVSGIRLSMVSSMLTAIVTVVGIATVIHLVVSYRGLRAAGLEPAEALATCGEQLMGPILWSCATDAVGFGSLYISEVGPVKSFGLMTALGAVYCGLAVGVIVPGLTLAAVRFDGDPRRAWGESHLEKWLGQMALVIALRPKRFLLVSTLVVAFFFAGLAFNEVETDFTKNFRSNSPVVTSYRFVEERLGGAGAWDVLISVPPKVHEKNKAFEAFLDRVRAFEQRVRSEALIPGPDGQMHPGLTKVVSLTDALDAVEEVMEKNDPTGGLSGLLSLKARIGSLQKMVPPFANAVYRDDPDRPGAKLLRVMLRSREQQTADAKAALIAKVQQIAGEEFPAEADTPAAEVTGYFVLLANLIESLLADQWISFGLAAGGILLMLIVATRSLVQSLIAIVPNAVPIVMVLGGMGWLGVKVNMGTVMIASVSMGLAVDSSIHYLAALRRERAAGKTLLEGLEAVHRSVGLAMVLSTLALVVGFAALALSHFIPTIYFGVLVSLAMLGGLIGNLVLLPVLLRLCLRDQPVRRESAAATD